MVQTVPVTGERNVPVPAAAFLSYAEAAAMRPDPNPAVGPGSTDLPLPDAIKVLSVVELLEGALLEGSRSESLSSVLARRRSVREYGPLTAADLVRVLDQVFRLRAYAEADDGAVRRFRAIPSAGARHPVIPVVLTSDVDGLESGLWRHDTDGRRLLLVETDAAALDLVWTQIIAAGQFDQRPPAVIVLGAKFDATLARYPSGTALVWRDAGVALGALHLSATAADLASCVLGTAGLLDEPTLAASGLVGDVGSLAIGGLSHASRRSAR